jgi:hypothetical protein
MSELRQFVELCKKVQPQSQEDVQRFFEGVAFFPYDNELLLQAFLFLNITDYFPACSELLLFEKSPNGENTDQGKCDFVYLTKDNRIALIETKFIDTRSSGSTERTRRNGHRSKVFKQVITLREKFSEIGKIPLELVDCCVFTTDDLTHRNEAANINTKCVSIKRLRQWQQETRSILRSKGNVPVQRVFEAAVKEVNDSDLDELSKTWMEQYVCDSCSHPELCAGSKMCYFDLSGGD